MATSVFLVMGAENSELQGLDFMKETDLRCDHGDGLIRLLPWKIKT